MVFNFREQTDFPDSREIKDFTPTELDALPISSPIRKFHAVWAKLRELAGGIPRRKDFRPSDVPEALPWITLFERIEEQAAISYRVRLQGTAALEWSRSSWTGGLLSDRFVGKGLEGRMAQFNRCLQEGRFEIGFSNICLHDIEWSVTRGIFPFIGKDGNEQIIFIGYPERTRKN